MSTLSSQGCRAVVLPLLAPILLQNPTVPNDSLSDGISVVQTAGPCFIYMFWLAEEVLATYVFFADRKASLRPHARLTVTAREQTILT
ncbi:hypothetical protein B0H14DRAFT_3525663 [Mycena olivaceomarginata]|nr:hypothetical protein B0H14DRAFT_3525663 [Mycena olivaceomarginata]